MIAQAIDTKVVRDEMLKAASDAAEKFFQERLGGVDSYACGFSWVTIYPKNKGNTKAGRAEREVIKALGFRLDWTGKAFELWNPSNHSCQNVDIKEAGAVAAAAVLKKYGFNAYANSRLD